MKKFAGGEESRFRVSRSGKDKARIGMVLQNLTMIFSSYTPGFVAKASLRQELRCGPGNTNSQGHCILISFHRLQSIQLISSILSRLVSS